MPVPPPDSHDGWLSLRLRKQGQWPVSGETRGRILLARQGSNAVLSCDDSDAISASSPSRPHDRLQADRTTATRTSTSHLRRSASESGA